MYVPYFSLGRRERPFNAMPALFPSSQHFLDLDKKLMDFSYFRSHLALDLQRFAYGHNRENDKGIKGKTEKRALDQFNMHERNDHDAETRRQQTGGVGP
jgi:hypothetical protein